jgi:hypothetical protein
VTAGTRIGLRALAVGHLVWGLAISLSWWWLVVAMADARGGVATSAQPFRDYAVLVQGWGLFKFVLALVCLFCVRNLFAAGYLLCRKRRRFTLAVAVANTLFFPVGSLLGVLTLYALTRPATREAYRRS